MFILIPIFLIALVLRFLYFPNNIYFGYDQARDAFAALEILSGQFKIQGPPTTFEGLNHGVLYYYLYAPFYFFGNGDPTYAAAFLRVVNSLGIFLIFIISRILFNKYVGFISAFLFAISFEQTQFALYLNHPSLAIISILVMYLGLVVLIFKRSNWGLLLALLGLGLSIQFEFILTYLIVPFLVILLFFRRLIFPLSSRVVFLASVIFLTTISSFIVAEIKFSFRTLHSIPQLLFGDSHKSIYKIISTYFFEMGQVIKFSIVGIDQLSLISGAIFIAGLIFTFFKNKKQMFFLSIWFFSGIIIYLISGGGNPKEDIIQYHPNMGISISLMIFVSYLLYKIGKKTHYLITLTILSLIFMGNILQIQKINPYGSMPEINAQSYMLLSDEKRVLDFIYKDAQGKQFAVKAITMPFYINITWSYLFEWYGKQKYGYLPIWGGVTAAGYPGNLIVEDAQDKLPQKQYLIIEPVRGIPQHLINEYLKEEGYFTNLIKEYEIGHFKIQTRIKK